MRKKKDNLITMKIKFSTNEFGIGYISHVREDYNKILRFTYNRLIDNPSYSTKELTAFQSKLNNIDSCKSHLKNSSIYNAKEIYNRNKNDNPQKIIFGGFKNFIERCKLSISKEKFTEKRTLPIYSVGESNRHGNRLFQIIDTNTIIFKPDKLHHIALNLENVGNNRKKILLKLIELQKINCISLTYQLDLEYVYITYDNNLFEYHKYPVKTNRTMQIDVNPNYIGWTVTDWKQDYDFHLVESGMFSLEPLNKYQNSLNVSSDSKEAKYITNKRRHEVIEIAKELFKICKHYHCEVFSMEDLSMKATNLNKGRKLNKLVNNQWNRNLLFQQIRKHILASSTELVEVQPQYSSIIGNLVNRKLELPDPILASIEIGRRGHEFSCQYIFKRRQHNKTVVFPKLESVKESIILSLEELGIDLAEINDWKDLWSVVKKSKVKYRFPLLDRLSSSPFSKYYKQKRQIVYAFNSF